MKKKILIVLTNIAKYEKASRATGLWLGELTHFYDVVKNAGYDIDFVSPKGGYVPIDPHSFKYANEVDWKFYQDREFQKKALINTLKPSDINPLDYEAIYYTGGHGVLWDFPNDDSLAKIATEIYQNGGVVSAVCHGVVGLLNVKNNNDYLINNKQVTGFTNLEEMLNMTSRKVPFSTKDELKKRGAIYKERIPFTPFVVEDDRLITGQNPQSPKKVAEALVKKLKQLNSN